MMLLNAIYRSSAVGTGTYTRNLTDALPEARALVFPSRLTHQKASLYWMRRTMELAAGALPLTVVNPYWSAGGAKHSIISALDLVQYRQSTKLERSVLRRSLLRAVGVLTLSAKVASEISAEFGIDTVVAPPFPDCEWYTQRPRQQPSSAGRIRIAYWGGRHPRKGIDEFRSAIMKTNIGTDVEFVCAGSSVGNGVKFSRRQLVDMVDSCHLSVYPSREEGFGLPVFESLLRYRPVIVRRLEVYGEFARASAGLVYLDDISPESACAAVERAIAIGPRRPEDTLVSPSRKDAIQQLRRAVLVTGILG